MSPLDASTRVIQPVHVNPASGSCVQKQGQTVELAWRGQLLGSLPAPPGASLGLAF